MICLPRPRSTRFPFAVLFSGVVLALALLPGTVLATSSTIVISQVYGGGGNTGATLKNDFIELYNLGAATVDVSAGPCSTPRRPAAWQKTNLLGTDRTGPVLPDPGGRGRRRHDGPAYARRHRHDRDGLGAGKVALVNNDDRLRAGRLSSRSDDRGLRRLRDGANCFEGGRGRGTTNTTAVLRGQRVHGHGQQRRRLHDGRAQPEKHRECPQPCSGPTPPTGVGAANPASVPAGGSALLTVAVTRGANPTSTGLAVTANLSAIGGSANQPFFDDGTNGDVTAGDNVFSYQATVRAARRPVTRPFPSPSPTRKRGAARRSRSPSTRPSSRSTTSRARARRRRSRASS